MLWFGRRRRSRRGWRGFLPPRPFPGTPPTVPWAGRPVFHDPPRDKDEPPAPLEP